MQKLPTAVLAGLLTLIMPVMFNTIMVNPAIAQTDTDTDTDTDIDTDTDTDTDTDLDTDTDTDTDTSTPVGGIETGGGGTATDGVN